MSKISSSFSQVSPSRKILFLIVAIMIFGISTVAFSVYSQENILTAETEPTTSEAAPVK